MSEKILILGGSGMLGSMVASYLSSLFEGITCTVRSDDMIDKCSKKLANANWIKFDVNDYLSSVENYSFLNEYAWIVNCIGITKPFCKDDNPAQIQNAISVNSLFPNLLSKNLIESKTKIIQIATDCVYSGFKGDYTETDKHDALDVYGKTKSLGETKYHNTYNLRCSIIGPEFDRNTFLIEWFLNQPQHASVNGFDNHDWNGVTTLQFAKITGGIITNQLSPENMQHLIPSGKVTKYEMLKIFAKYYQRDDITINKHSASETIDRTLSTVNHEMNEKLWLSAGYSKIPTFEDMIKELTEFDYKFKN